MVVSVVEVLKEHFPEPHDVGVNTAHGFFGSVGQMVASPPCPHLVGTDLHKKCLEYELGKRGWYF